KSRINTRTRTGRRASFRSHRPRSTRTSITFPSLPISRLLIGPSHWQAVCLSAFAVGALFSSRRATAYWQRASSRRIHLKPKIRAFPQRTEALRDPFRRRDSRVVDSPAGRFQEHLRPLDRQFHLAALAHTPTRAQRHLLPRREERAGTADRPVGRD